MDHNLINKVNNLAREVIAQYARYDFVSAFAKIKDILYLGNMFLSQQ